MSRTIFFDAPQIGDEDKVSLMKAMDSGYVSSAGHWVGDFEKKFAQYLNVPEAVSTQNGTAALHIALYELGIGEGDEVIVPVLTFVASVNPVRYVGAKPVFVDVDPKTWNMDTAKIEKCITKKTKAILPVHLFGNPCDMGEIMNIAQKYNLYVIEDAAEGLGATYNKEWTGTIGDVGCFSFNGNKLITTGSGGMVVSSDQQRLKHIKYLVNQARDNAVDYFHSEIGFNYRMSSLHAALGLAQIKKISRFIHKKKSFNRIYQEELTERADLYFQESYAGAESSCWLTSIVFNKDIDIPKLQNKLMEKGVPTRRMFMPIVEFPPYQKFKKGSYPHADHIYRRGLGLPNSMLNQKEDIYRVCKILKKTLG